MKGIVVLLGFVLLTAGCAEADGWDWKDRYEGAQGYVDEVKAGCPGTLTMQPYQTTILDSRMSYTSKFRVYDELIYCLEVSEIQLEQEQILLRTVDNRFIILQGKKGNIPLSRPIAITIYNKTVIVGELGG